MPQASLFHCFENAPDHEIRGVAFTLPRESIREQTLFPHQQDAVDRVIANEWSSGILHLPTGSGKTRVGIELAARLLHDNRENRIIWATHPRILVRQGMARMAELGGLFPTGTKVKWITSGERSRDLFSEAQVLFVMREDLVNLMGCAHDGRYMQEPISEFLGRRRGQTLTVIYDESSTRGELAAGGMGEVPRQGSFSKNQVAHHRSERNAAAHGPDAMGPAERGRLPAPR
jgi:superfamily II DNA or RNA helicase